MQVVVVFAVGISTLMTGYEVFHKSCSSMKLPELVRSGIEVGGLRGSYMEICGGLVKVA